MGVIKVRLPDDTHQRVKALAASRKTSANLDIEATIYPPR